jgi:hypothetical protein
MDGWMARSSGYDSCLTSTCRHGPCSDIYEQAEVEAQLLATGVLLPNYHQMYWMGLVTGERAQ